MCVCGLGRCMEPFFSKRKQVNWTIVLKLYLAAMQRPEVREECWSIVMQRQSHFGWDGGCVSETLHAIREFIQSHEFDGEYSLGMVYRSIRSAEYLT